MAITKSRVEKNVQRIREDIAAACARAGRRPEEVSIVAVTKAAGMDAIRALLDAGHLDLGENRAQQLSQRAAEVEAMIRRRRNPMPGPVRWHMVGHLQRNKVRLVMGLDCVIHSLDSLRLAEAINDRAESDEKTTDVYLQVNCSEESQKFGIPVAAAAHMGELLRSLKNLRLLGLMTMAPLARDPEKARPAFVRLRELFEEMRGQGLAGPHFAHLSMGMSQDYAVAVEEGATVLRIGTALFE